MPRCSPKGIGDNVSIAYPAIRQRSHFPNRLDLAWVTQNYHDLKIAKYGKVDTLAFDRAVYKALKPGGTFFILDHQGRAGMTDEDIATMHRIDKAGGHSRGHRRRVQASCGG